MCLCSLTIVVLVPSQCKIHQHKKSLDHLANDCTNINMLKYFNVTCLPLFTLISFTNSGVMEDSWTDLSITSLDLVHFSSLNITGLNNTGKL